jgi:hypothetical protein
LTFCLPHAALGAGVVPNLDRPVRDSVARDGAGRMTTASPRAPAWPAGSASPRGRVTEQAPLTGDSDQTWMAGCNRAPARRGGSCAATTGRCGSSEVAVTGPKTWSLAAALHPDIATAYDAAQARAAVQIIGWLGDHATTRVGPGGGQVQVPVEVAGAERLAR